MEIDERHLMIENPVAATVASADGTFTAYGATHLAMVGILVAGSVVVVWLGRRRRDHSVAGRDRRLFATLFLAFVLPMQVAVLVSTDYDVNRQLPIQLCDLAAFVAPYALLTLRRWAVALTYFWGLTLIPQAIATPNLAQGFPSPAFVLFWGMHFLVAWAALYLTWGLRHPPTWRSYRITCAITFAWLVAMFSVNAALGSNYGYVNAKPSTASVLDYLGPWPIYVLAEIVIIASVWALMTWPWMRRGAVAAASANVLDRTASGG
jgi:hypothetical integral membrane protein (TIGR02206 family)